MRLTACGVCSGCGASRTTPHLWWFARHRLTPERIRAALEETICRVSLPRGRIGQVALDSTGLWLSHCSRYFASRTKRERSQRA